MPEQSTAVFLVEAGTGSISGGLGPVSASGRCWTGVPHVIPPWSPNAVALPCFECLVAGRQEGRQAAGGGAMEELPRSGLCHLGTLLGFLFAEVNRSTQEKTIANRLVPRHLLIRDICLLKESLCKRGDLLLSSPLH